MVALVAVMAGPTVGRPASAQVVIGDDRPAVTVDQGVLDRLGTERTLPDLFLGRQVSSVTPSIDSRQYRNIPAATQTPVYLHKPLHKAVVRHIPKAKPAAATVTKVAATAPVPVIEARNDGGKPEADKAKPAEAVATQAASPPAAAATATPASTSEPAVTLPVTAPVTPLAAVTPATTSAKIDMAPTPITSPPPPAKAEAPPPPAKVEAPPPPAPTVTAAAQPLPVVAAPPPPALSPPPYPAPAPAPALSPASSPAPAPAPSQEARLPPADGATSIIFEKDQARLPDDARAVLTQLAGRLAAETAMEVQLLAYAEGDENSASKARRLSLSRALAVRSFLIDQGVRSARIEVRALGNKVSDGPSDRVDLVVQKH